MRIQPSQRWEKVRRVAKLEAYTKCLEVEWICFSCEELERSRTTRMKYVSVENDWDLSAMVNSWKAFDWDWGIT